MEIGTSLVLRVAYFFFKSYILTSSRWMALSVLLLRLETVAASASRMLGGWLERLALSFCLDHKPLCLISFVILFKHFLGVVEVERKKSLDLCAVSLTFVVYMCINYWYEGSFITAALCGDGTIELQK